MSFHFFHFRITLALDIVPILQISSHSFYFVKFWGGLPPPPHPGARGQVSALGRVRFNFLPLNSVYCRKTEAVDLRECARAIQVNEKMKGVMYFTWGLIRSILVSLTTECATWYLVSMFQHFISKLVLLSLMWGLNNPTFIYIFSQPTSSLNILIFQSCMLRTVSYTSRVERLGALRMRVTIILSSTVHNFISYSILSGRNESSLFKLLFLSLFLFLRRCKIVT